MKSCRVLLLLSLCLFQINNVNSGPMRNYTKGYHPAGGADPKYLNYGEGIVVPNLLNPRIPGPGISLTPQHHLDRYVGVKPGPADFEYYSEDGDEYYEYEEYDRNAIIPELVIPLDYHGPSTNLETDATTNNAEEQHGENVIRGDGYEASGESETAAVYSGKVHCRDGGQGYRSGEVFTLVADPCTKCKCSRFGPKCNRTQCLPLPRTCYEIIIRPGECCPVCFHEGCTFRNRTLTVGESVRLSSCETCHCGDDGRMDCSVADCTPPPCVDAVVREGECCPVCPNGPNCYTKTRIKIPARELWVSVPDKRCTICRCWHKAGSQQLWMGNRVAECKPDPRCGK